jgi:hypothetical protein
MHQMPVLGGEIARLQPYVLQMWRVVLLSMWWSLWKMCMRMKDYFDVEGSYYSEFIKAKDRGVLITVENYAETDLRALRQVIIIININNQI